MNERTKWPWKIEPYTEAEIEALMKQEALKEQYLEDCQDEQCDELAREKRTEGFTEFSDYETSFAKVKRIMKEGQAD